MVTCPNCENEMGLRAKYCNLCGHKMPQNAYEPSIDELEEDEKLYEMLGGKCGAEYHAFLGALAASDKSANFCPECGRLLAYRKEV